MSADDPIAAAPAAPDAPVEDGAILVLRFEASGNADPYLVSGWASGEREFRWSTGKRSVLSLPALPRGTLLHGYVLLSPHVYPGVPQPQFGIEIEGRIVGSWRVAERAELDFAFAVEESGETRITFIHPDAKQPGGPDDRELAFAVERLMFHHGAAPNFTTVLLGTVASTDSPRFARALALLDRSRQCNTTGRTWTADNAAAFFAAGGRWRVFSAADRLTSYGLVGVLATEGDRIEQFAMSSRAFGLGIETAVLARIVADAEGRTVTARLVDTGLNRRCHDLYRDAGWQAAGEDWQSGPATVPARDTLTLELDDDPPDQGRKAEKV